MFTPFYWNYRDPDIGLNRTLIPPIYYRNTSPRSDDLAILPFYAHFNRPGLRDVTWATPLVRYAHDVTGWETDVFPLFFTGRKREASHLVVAPFYWDFKSPQSRVTVAPPLYLRIADGDASAQVLLNTYYRKKKVEGGLDWEFHFFPAFAFGGTPHGHWWNVLYGLAGYTAEGTASHMRAFWIPIPLSE
jgi:hypothetical protein